LGAGAVCRSTSAANCHHEAGRRRRPGGQGDDRALTPEALLLAREAGQERRKALGGALAALEPEARRVLALRFGLEGEAHTVTEAARALGWSVLRVRQVEAGALTALRERMGAGVGV
jgi:DNA-directed RNA polymerase sigma subunit (sigma70/sigma32)